MILCFRFLLWDVTGPAGHRWRWPVALLHTLTPQCVRYHPGAVSASLGCGGGDSLFLLSASPFLHFQLLQHVRYVICYAVNRWRMFLILLSSTLSPVSVPLLSHLLCQLVWLVSVIWLFWCQSTRLSAVCWKHLHYTHLPGTAFSALNHFPVQCLIFLVHN